MHSGNKDAKAHDLPEPNEYVKDKTLLFPVYLPWQRKWIMRAFLQPPSNSDKEPSSDRGMGNNLPLSPLQNFGIDFSLK